MAPVREKKKAQTKERIFGTARQLFTEKGYVKTSVEEIAEDAQVGVGTVYNYFGSKRGLLFAMLGEDTDGLFRSGEKVVASARGDPEKAIMDLFGVYAALYGKYDRKLMRELAAAAIADTESMGREFPTLDYRLIGQVSALLEKLQKMGRLDKGISVDEAALILYSVFSTLGLIYLQYDDMDPGAIREEFGSSVRTMLKSWLR